MGTIALSAGQRTEMDGAKLKSGRGVGSMLAVSFS
jgi:hypothetical protein